MVGGLLDCAHMSVIDMLPTLESILCVCVCVCVCFELTFDPFSSCARLIEDYEKLVEKEALLEKPRRPSLVDVSTISAVFGLPLPATPHDQLQGRKEEEEPPKSVEDTHASQ